MILRTWRHRLPRFAIPVMLLIAGIAIVIEVETEKDVGGSLPDSGPVSEIESRTFVVGQEPGDVIYDGARVWVAETGFGTVTSYGPDGQRLDTADVGGKPAKLASGDGFVWALDADDGSVTQLDASATVLRKFQVGLEPVDLEFLGEHVWVTDPSRNSVSQISTQGGLTRQLEIDVSSGLVTSTPEQVLVVDGHSRTVTGIDAGGEIVGTFKYPDRIALDGFEHVPGAPSAFLSTPDYLWLAFGGVGQVMRLTPAGAHVGTTRVPTGHISMAWIDGELWVTSADAGTLTRISALGDVLQTHTLGGSPVAIAFDGENAWIVDDERNVLTMLLPG